MNFKVDENLPREAAELLREAGHDAQTVYDEDLQGRPDSAVAERCKDENRILVTIDRGFSDLRIYAPEDYPGFVVLRPRWQDKYHVLALLGRAVPVLSQERFEHHPWIVEETRIRIRPTEPS